MKCIRRILSAYKKRRNLIQYWREQGVQIGENCAIDPGASFGSEPYLISLGNHVRINSGVLFKTHDGGVWVLRGLKEEYRDIDIFGKITVGDNVHIGTNSIIMPGVRIGSNCIIGCGAIVTRDIPDNSVAVGVPARVIRSIGEYEQRHMADFMHTKAMSREEKKRFLMNKDL